MAERFPKAYTGQVRRDDALMEYTTIDRMGIGARKSGLPDKASDGPKNIEHVGKSAQGKEK
ncbi:MAG: hypothetical protein KGL39_04960 [Patescibacteria group bacterium]|nr:hypothetical protein [Patescibacteria group bacterium]